MWQLTGQYSRGGLLRLHSGWWDDPEAVTGWPILFRRINQIRNSLQYFEQAE
jgi:hypothetical protein